jgi:hypothetical protein
MPIESDSVACSNTTAEPHEYFDHTGADDVFAEHTGWSLCGPHPFAGLLEQPIELQGDHVLEFAPTHEG